MDEPKKIPTARELLKLAEAAGHDSFGIMSDPELQEVLEEMREKAEGGPPEENRPQ